MLLSTLDSFFHLLTVLFIFVIVLGLTYATTRWIAGYQKGKTTATNIEVIETHKVTANKYLQIVRMGDKYFGIGIGKDEITMLTELNPDEIQMPEAVKPITTDSFKSILEKVRNKKENK